MSAEELTHGSVSWAADLGITYRQLDYWCRRGYLRPSQAGTGSGYDRWWSPLELDVARRMVALVDEGYQPAAAARKARLLALTEAMNRDIAQGGWDA